jgi:hypothetical protein
MSAVVTTLLELAALTRSARPETVTVVFVGGFTKISPSGTV